MHLGTKLYNFRRR